MGSYVRRREEFINNNSTAYATWVNDKTYVVYSYGEHFPMYIWQNGRWFGNEDKYSMTTSNHQSSTNPGDPTITWCDTKAMKWLAAA